MKEVCQEFIAFLNCVKIRAVHMLRSPEQLLYYASWLSKKAEELLPRYFNKLYQDYHLQLIRFQKPLHLIIRQVVIQEVRFERKMRAGQYWVNTYKLEYTPNVYVAGFNFA